MKNYRYEVTCYMQNEHLIDDVIQLQLSDACGQLKKKLSDCKLDPINVQKSFFIMGIEAQVQLNLSKVLRMIERSFYGINIDFKKTLIITMPCETATEDVRLRKLIEHIEEVGYYDLHEYFSGDLQQFKAYLLTRKLGVIEQGERIFLIDLEALNQKINLNCIACTQKYQYGCCCGSPCNMSSRNYKNFMQHEKAMGEIVRGLEPETYTKIQQTGGFVFLDGTINEYEGRCGLLIKEGDSYRCIPHKYALEQNIPIYELCPLSCLMYPFEILVLETRQKRHILFLTSVVEENFAQHYGRWGSYKNLGIDQKCIRINDHDDTFVLKDYKPVYQVNKGLICHEFGNELYEGIQHLYEYENK